LGDISTFGLHAEKLALTRFILAFYRITRLFAGIAK
jgi:hypothetical protein